MYFLETYFQSEVGESGRESGAFLCEISMKFQSFHIRGKPREGLLKKLSKCDLKERGREVGKGSVKSVPEHEMC